MSAESPQIIVAGHVCVDLIPQFGATEVPLDQLLRPGQLTFVGPALLSAGGAVSNTGLALHRLGLPVKLMGKIGADLFGQAALTVLGRFGEHLTDGMIVAPDEASSYTLVINPPGVDRIFLHCPGANDTYAAADVPLDQVAGVRLFHFGYPPLMRRMYLDDGAELAELMRRVHALGVTTSLDMARPDPDAEAGRVDWRRIVVNTLPYVDIFMPSVDEMLFMLDRPRFDALQQNGPAAVLDGALLHDLGGHLLALGAAVVGLKLGNLGLYLRTTSDPARLAAAGLAFAGLQESWLGRELLTPCFSVEERGTTGSGDCTIAGLLASLLHGEDAEQGVIYATAVGACRVESTGGSEGVPHWDAVQGRLAAGWAKHPLGLPLPGWRAGADGQLWYGPADREFQP